MALDMLRAISKSDGEVLRAFKGRVIKILDECAKSNEPDIVASFQATQEALLNLMDFINKHQRDPARMEIAARDICVSLGSIYISALLLEHALHTQKRLDAYAAKLWTQKHDLCPVSTQAKAGSYLSLKNTNLPSQLVFENFSE